MNFTLYPIYALANDLDGEPFDENLLPFRIIGDVTIERVEGRFRAETFDNMRERLGSEVVGNIRGVRYALVHRYQPNPIIVDGEIIGEQMHSEQSDVLLRNLAACLRLIRPMRQNALSMRGNVRDDDRFFEVTGCDIPPLHLIEVPDVQKLFGLRNRDAENLRSYAPEFLRAMAGDFWKFRMAIQFHELGHFQPLDWKARFLLWCSAIESVYTSHNWEHHGSLVATSRIKWFIGENVSIYAPGDISRLLNDPHITIAQIVRDLYEMRNFLAHGDRLPNSFFTEAMRRGFNGPIQKREVLLETASFVIRTTLLKILRDGLLDHFAGADTAEAYFAAWNLTKSALRGAP